MWKEPRSQFLKCKDHMFKHATCRNKSSGFCFQSPSMSSISFHFPFPPGENHAAESRSSNTCDTVLDSLSEKPVALSSVVGTPGPTRASAADYLLICYAGAFVSSSNTVKLGSVISLVSSASKLQRNINISKFRTMCSRDTQRHSGGKKKKKSHRKHCKQAQGTRSTGDSSSLRCSFSGKTIP